MLGTLETRQMLSVAGFEAASLAPDFVGPISWPTLQANAVSVGVPDSSAGTTPTDPYERRTRRSFERRTRRSCEPRPRRPRAY